MSSVPKIIHCFFDFDMRCNHAGILAFLKKKKIQITEDDFIVFMNSKRNMIKMMCRGKDAILHYRQEGRILDPGIVAYLPHYVNGNKLNIEGAIQENLEGMLERHKRRRGKIE
jgi:hypothetical protein